ncbi:uncharacterized protein LOC134178140 [Corticium candelabrum]|uniref:uncharacterized protein LOC134178140 n=1 Tax=Corticium candelabrum TaxID=121492 RepID=UPI002E26C8B5|nr:uncharacterized protein LOC134178140 [Corticium candelabrum]
MATSGIHPPPPFLPHPGEPAVPWKHWLSAFDTYVAAAAIKDEADNKPRLRALLTHCLGLEGQRILSTETETESYVQLRDVCATLFGPRLNSMVERFKFRQRKQHQGESVKQYVFALRQLAATCKFGPLHDEMIRDQLIEKTVCGKVRDRLLEEDEDLTLDKAIVLASRMEEAARDSATIATVSGSVMDAVPGGLTNTALGQLAQESRGIRQVQTRPGKSGWSSRGDGKCGNCGFSVHKGSTCPASTQTCRKCGRIGHYARCCRSKKQSQIQEVDCGNEQGVELETVRINVVGGQSSTLEYRQCVCELAGVSLSLVIDLGAKVSVLSKRSYDRWFSWSKLEPANRKLVGYAGSPIKVLGRKLRQPLSQMIPRQDKKGSLQLKNADEVVARKQAAMKAYVDHKRRARASSFSPGSWVRVKRPLRGHKLKSQLSDPVEVWSRVGKDTYLLQDGRLWHADQLIAVAKPAGVANTAAVLSWTDGEEVLNSTLSEYTTPTRQLCYLDTCTCMTRAVARDCSCTCQCLVVKAPTY